MLPMVVVQALDDVQMPPLARLCMWHLTKRLDTIEYREVKIVSLAHEMRCKDVSAGEVVRRLIADGYLDEHRIRKPRALRFPISRRASAERHPPDAEQTNLPLALRR
ncbi:MAG: hypothetical protein ACK5X3_00950 [Pseudomonadota bacterium]|jgi:hypothetical protein